MKAVAEIFGVSQSTTLFYSPRQNSVERVHKFLHALMTRCIQSHEDWFGLLKFVQSAYNNTTHSSHSFVPNYLFFGGTIPSVTSVLLADPLHTEATHGEQAAETAQRMQRAYAQVQ